MSRSFNPTTGADSITFSVGNAPPDQGPITIAVLAKSLANTFTGYLVNGRASGSVWAALTSNNPDERLFAESDFGNGVASVVNGSWRWYVITKASGSVQPRMHIWDLSSAWTHTNNTANVGDGSGPITSLIVGGNGSGSQGWRGSIAVVAAWDSALSDAAVEAAMTLKASDVFAASPKWMVRLNQASTATSVTDDTAGGGNQTALSGTTVDSDDPPGFSYSLSAGSSGATPSGIAVPAALGNPATALSLSTAPSGVALTAAPGTPSTALTGTVPSGVAVPAALGTPSSGPAGAGPTGIHLATALGNPVTALSLSTAPAGVLRTVLLGQPSSLAPAAYDSGHPRIVTSSTARRLETVRPAARITTSTRAARVTD